MKALKRYKKVVEWKEKRDGFGIATGIAIILVSCLFIISIASDYANYNVWASFICGILFCIFTSSGIYIVKICSGKGRKVYWEEVK